MLYNTIREDMQKAMKEKDDLRLQTLRLTLSACTNELVATGKKPNEILDDDTVITIVKRLVKQRNESAAQYRTAGQEERAANEDKERAVLESYLPPEMSEEKIRQVVIRVQKELGVSEKKDTGLLMKTVMQEFKGKANGATVVKIVSETLS